MSKITILDPTLEVVVTQKDKAQRPESFQVIGLVDNGKNNSAPLLKKVGNLIIEQIPGAEVKYYRKPALSRPAPAELLDQVKAECDVAVVGIGD
jgi:hypothetical protein